ncbi:MAG: acyl-CoA thioesterase [Alistipes sp.]|nr:acyl-CoA thioesterase [Alistipes sp.]
MFEPYKRRVYYYETDKMSIMHHSNYIRIFEETRVDFLRKAGMPFEDIEARGILMPVLSVECSYRRPLRFDEPFAVYLYITKFNGVLLHVNYRVVNSETGVLCAEGSSSHCFTDENLKPIRTKNAYPDIYKVFDDYRKECADDSRQ